MRRQRGAALLAMVAVLVMGASWALLTALAPVNRNAIDRDHNTKVLASAKQALLGDIALLAVTDKHPGRLRCPEPLGHVGDARYEGIAAPYPTSGQNTCAAIGRFPWRTIGIDRLHDAHGEPLWYAVTIGANGWAYQTSATVLSINSNKAGGLTVDGDTVVAAIIAPGKAFNVNPNAAQIAAGCTARVQSRTAVAADYRDYVECGDSAAGVYRSSVVDNGTNPVVNDQVVVITAAEVMAAIEPVIAKRLQNEVVPQLQDAYSSASWGGQIIFPYAARFNDDRPPPAPSPLSFNPDSYKGQLPAGPSPAQGLLPMTAQTCNALTSGRCDAAFVQWTVASFSVTKTGGSANLDPTVCTVQTGSQITCTISYSQVINLLAVGGVSITVDILVDAANVGRTLKRVTLTDATVTPIAPATKTGFNFGAALRTDAAASARVSTTGTLTGSNGLLGLCGTLIGILCRGQATVSIPISMFQDHVLVNPATTDSVYWFAANKWHEVTYYAVAPSHLPSGATHNCSDPLVNDCLTLSGNTPSANIRALLVLAGRSLNSSARPNATMSDFLEDATNQNNYTTGGRSFNWGQTRRNSYNDRFVSLGNY